MIVSAKWVSGKVIVVTLDDGRELSVPNDMTNAHRRLLQEWVDAGNSIDAADPPSPPPTNDEIYDQVIQNQKVLKAVVLALNDGSFVPGANASGADLKTAIKAKM